jgi:glycosyltransferase involved in cell wall biosynthesis
MLVDESGKQALRGRSLSVVVPVYNEQEVLPEFHRRMSAVLDALGMRSRIIYVNDGSTDHTALLIDRLRAADPRVTLLDLSRNFGKEIALTAGLDHADSDAVVVIDADLQDPPELVPELVAHWLAGYDVVYAMRTCRDGESAAKKVTAFLFYRLIQKMSRVRIPADTGDYRLLSRRAVAAVCRLREQHRFMKGLFAWIGFPQKAVPYRRAPRFAGSTKWNYWKLWNFALEGITSFTSIPLKAATYVGLASAGAAFVLGIYITLRTLIHGNPVPGYPSLLVAILFLGGMQLLAIGIIGEYLARMFDESKQRPLYFVKNNVDGMEARRPMAGAERFADAIDTIAERV